MRLYTAKPADGAAWITGASSGIGWALSMELARQGYTVFATARNADGLNTLAAASSGLKGQIIPLPGDVTNAEDMEQVVKLISDQEKPLVLAIFNAGIYRQVAGEAMRVDDFLVNFSVNLEGVVKGLVPAVEQMKLNKCGHVAIVSSVTGYGGLPTSAGYGATKAALINMAESLRFDFDKMNIRLQIINPGFVDTPATKANAFEMPALMGVEAAARRIAKGLRRNRFEITFPRRFTFVLKLMRVLPYPLYFWILNHSTGWRNRPLGKD